MRVWLDLSNSPHPLLFAPIVRRLRADGHVVLLTARDNAQTVELARQRWPDVNVIGGESPGGRLAKAGAIAGRIARLRRWAAANSPDVALSHNSYAQIVAATMIGIPAVTAMDFEYQPVNHLAFRLASSILVPEVLPLTQLRRQGATAGKLLRYPGLKEELYIGDFRPDDGILAQVGITPRPKVLVVARTPPQRAIYHSFGNPLFEQALRTLCAQPGVMCIVLARHAEQRDAIAALGLDGCLVPERAVDSRSLMYAADVMIGAGGTMTREAALLGIPTWTLFAGTPPAADVWLERRGRMRRLNDAAQLDDLRPRPTAPRAPTELRRAATAIEAAFVMATVRAARGQR